jgi:hypothetical protein
MDPIIIKNNMTNEEIKTEKQLMYDQIKMSQDRLAELRSICKHEKTFVGNYSWRIGCSQPADICEYCGELIRYKDTTFEKIEVIDLDIMSK